MNRCGEEPSRPPPRARPRLGPLGLQAGASESARFERALADYRQIVDQCGLRTP
ncbi:MAG TPA: hypothetical protein VGR74_19565 [Actinomycetota bacterium]|nr:hypothetical protein [Actinomycetota bacterium]